MIRILLDRAFDNEHHYIHAVGLSTDTKPTTGIITGSKFVAVDTGAGYLFDETAGEWNENQQLTEAVAAYLDDHPEALDQAAIEAIFDERLDGIEGDLGGLKSAIAPIVGVPEETFSDMDSLAEYSGWINNSNNWNNTGSQSYKCEIIPLEEKPGTVTFTVDAQSPVALRYAFLSQYNTPVDGASANVITKLDVGAGDSITVDIPNNARAIYCATVNNNKVPVFTVLVDYPGIPGRIDDVESDIEDLKAETSSYAEKITLNAKNEWLPNVDNDSGAPSVYTSSQSVVYLMKAGSDMSDFVGHTLYVRGTLKTNKNATITTRILSDRNAASATADTWITVSAEGVYTATTSGAGFYATVEDTGVTMNYKRVVLVDVTALYGAGKEPPKSVLDLIFDNATPESWSTETLNVYSTGIMKLSAVRNLGSGLGNPGESQYVILSPDGNVQMSSIANQDWSGWQEIGTYGQSRTHVIPIYNKVHGTIETDGMVSVIPLWGCWSDNAVTTGNAYHGGHVFHGWTTDRQHRVTIVQNIYRDDEAALFNYIPGDKSETNEGVFLRLRLGADNIGKGVLIVPVYDETTGNFEFTRAFVFGRLNIQSSPAGQIDPAGTGTGSSLPKNCIPASSNADGVKGDICFDSNYLYVCTATNTWKRVPLQAWT